MNFDEIIDRRGAHSSKWDKMERMYGVSPDDGIPMWVADMDFRPPDCVRDALQGMVDHGIFGYYGDDEDYRDAIGWWMKNRHGWEIDPAAIFSTHGLVNGTSLCVHSWTEPGDGILLFSPVYHAFSRVIRAANRVPVECPLVLEDGRYVMDFDAAEALADQVKMVVFCSPHNPGGRVWSPDEIRSLADYCERHDLMLVCDEIHQDLVYPGQPHTPAAIAAPEISHRLAMLNAPTKTFNLAGVHNGNVIVHDEKLRAQFNATMMGLGISPNAFGLHLETAAYSPEGAKWVDALMRYLDGNRVLFDDAINRIPGLVSMPLQGTYLAWVNFEGTGMTAEEYTRRIEKDARIAVNYGSTFGRGGETYLRFNFATQRSRVTEAVARIADAFSDLQ